MIVQVRLNKVIQKNKARSAPSMQEGTDAPHKYKLKDSLLKFS
jgi:hypothetical protein